MSYFLSNKLSHVQILPTKYILFNYQIIISTSSWICFSITNTLHAGKSSNLPTGYQGSAGEDSTYWEATDVLHHWNARPDLTYTVIFHIYEFSANDKNMHSKILEEYNPILLKCNKDIWRAVKKEDLLVNFQYFSAIFTSTSICPQTMLRFITLAGGNTTKIFWKHFPPYSQGLVLEKETMINCSWHKNIFCLAFRKGT